MADQTRGIGTGWLVTDKRQGHKVQITNIDNF